MEKFRVKTESNYFSFVFWNSCNVLQLCNVMQALSYPVKISK